MTKKAKTKSKAKKKAAVIGRPRINPKQVQKRRNVCLSDSLAAKARRLGNGNVSDGIRAALEAVE